MKKRKACKDANKQLGILSDLVKEEGEIIQQLERLKQKLQNNRHLMWQIVGLTFARSGPLGINLTVDQAIEIRNLIVNNLTSYNKYYARYAEQLNKMDNQVLKEIEKVMKRLIVPLEEYLK